MYLLVDNKPNNLVNVTILAKEIGFNVDCLISWKLWESLGSLLRSHGFLAQLIKETISTSSRFNSNTFVYETNNLNLKGTCFKEGSDMVALALSLDHETVVSVPAPIFQPHTEAEHVDSVI